MSLKSFFIASLIIHIIGAIALYFYYNPINFAPQPVGQFEEEQISPEAKEEIKNPNLIENKQKKLTESKAKPSPKKQSKIFRKEILKIKTTKESKKTDSSLNENPVVMDSTQEQALSEAKDPVPEIKAAFIETENPAVDLELSEIEEEEAATQNNTPLSGKIEKAEIEAKALIKDSEEEETKKQNNIPNPIQTTDDKPKDIDQMEEIEEETKKQSDIPDSLKAAEAIPEAIDQMEEIEEEEGAEEETPIQNSAPDPVKTVEAKPNKVSKGNNFEKTKFKSFQSLKQKRGNTSLTYPDFARRGGMEGTVSVAFFVSEQGLVDQIQLLSSSGHAELDNYVLRELARYEFLPGQETWVQYKIPFKLEGTEREYEKLRTKEKEEAGF